MTDKSRKGKKKGENKNTKKNLSQIFFIGMKIFRVILPSTTWTAFADLKSRDFRTNKLN